MGAKTGIEWTDSTWTPIRARRRHAGHTLPVGKVGWYCQKVSPACKHCYAERMNLRLGTGIGYTVPELAEIEIFLDEKMLIEPLRWRKSRRVFVCSMTDLFADFVSDEMIDRVFAVMALCPHDTFQLLTKRPKRMKEYIADCSRGRQSELRRAIEAISGGLSPLKVLEGLARVSGSAIVGPLRWAPLSNVWLGVSAENQATANERIPLLLQTPAAVRFVSCEPLLGPMDIGRYVGLPGVRIDDPLGRCANCGRPGSVATEHRYDEFYDGEWACSERCEVQHRDLGCPLEFKPLDWVIAGGESGPGARPMHPDWARSLRDQCQAAGVPFFFKQWGEWLPEGVCRERRLTVSQHLWLSKDGVQHAGYSGVDDVRCWREGRKHSGAALDGREWKEFPVAR